jgi:hypothetical protein
MQQSAKFQVQHIASSNLCLQGSYFIEIFISLSLYSSLDSEYYFILLPSDLFSKLC